MRAVVELDEVARLLACCANHLKTTSVSRANNLSQLFFSDIRRGKRIVSESRKAAVRCKQKSIPAEDHYSSFNPGPNFFNRFDGLKFLVHDANPNPPVIWQT